MGKKQLTDEQIVWALRPVPSKGRRKSPPDLPVARNQGTDRSLRGGVISGAQVEQISGTSAGTRREHQAETSRGQFVLGAAYAPGDCAQKVGRPRQWGELAR